MGALAGCLCTSCTWDAWVPESRSPTPSAPDVPTRNLQLDARLSDTLDCTSGVCNQRFRLAVEQSGELEIDVRMSLENEREAMRLVLEHTASGVLARRGTLADPPPLAIRQAVEPGIYFVLIQGTGGRIPYEVWASLTASEDPSEEVAAAPDAAESIGESPPREPQRQLIRSAKSFGSEASWDPSARFSSYRTFAFAEAPREPGSPLEQPHHRSIHRALAAELERKGLAAVERDQADLLVGFGIGATTRTWFGQILPIWYDRWDAAGVRVRSHAYTQGTLSVDIVDPKLERLIWHGWTSKGLEPATDEIDVIQRAAADVLAKFPPDR